MECEKFEPLLLDELYEELDELTSAAVKRHVSGCARCASILGDMSATRRAVSLPLVPAPAGLEDRIFAAAKEAQKVVPIKSRMSRVLSVAGSWAMRPQTAMAAVFLLMIGTSAFLIRSKNYASKDAAVSVTVAGAPAPTVATPQSESLDDKAAAAAHGPTPPNITRPPAAAPAASAVALAESEGNGLVDRITEGAARDKAKADESGSLASAFGDPNTAKDSKAGAGAHYAPPAPTTAPAPVVANAAAPAGAPNDYAQQAPPPPARRAGPTGEDPFSLGAAAFRARNFAEATRQYDIAAQTGDPTAALWAAESVREGKGCAFALGRFDQLAQKATGSWAGHEAALRAARCEIAMGQAAQLDSAKARLEKLSHVASHQQAAQQALADMNQVASRKSAGGSAPGAAAAPAKAPAAAPHRAEAQEQKKALDNTRNGY
jgi:hypothetical protein